MDFPHHRLTGKIRYVLAVALGTLIPLSLAPFNIYPFTILSIMGLIYLWQTATRKEALYLGWCYGVGMYGAGVSWIYVSIHVYGYTPPVISIITTALFVALLSTLPALQAWLYRTLNLQNHMLLAFPALWVLFEWLRGWLLTGFPWLFIGYGFIDTPLASTAPVLGVFGVSLTICFCACLAYTLFDKPSPRRRFSAITLFALLTLSFLLQSISWTQDSKHKPLKVSLIQGNIPQEIKWLPQQQQPIMDLYANKTETQWHNDIILWPEAAIPAYHHEIPRYLDYLNNKAKQTNTTLISGIPYVEFDRQGEPKYFNSIFATGDGEGIYHKEKLVPFGEYIPFDKYLRGLLPFLDLPMSGFTRGGFDQNHLRAGNLKVAPYICYEILYPDFVAKTSKDADLLVTISNDAWFGRSIGPQQHFEMARMRALELGKPLLRATNNGITAHINKKGKIVAQAPSDKLHILESSVQRNQGTTPFAIWGSVPVLAFCLLLIACGLLFSLSDRRQKAKQLKLADLE